MGFTYDNVGNRKSETRNSQADIYTYYPGTNRLQAVSGPHAELFQYDDDGNTTARTPGAANPAPGSSGGEVAGGSSGTPFTFIHLIKTIGGLRVEQSYFFFNCRLCYYQNKRRKQGTPFIFSHLIKTIERGRIEPINFFFNRRPCYLLQSECLPSK
jgi:hypothetical protein